MEAPSSRRAHGGKACLVGAGTMEKTKPMLETLSKTDKKGNTLASFSYPSVFHLNLARVSKRVWEDSLQSGRGGNGSNCKRAKDQHIGWGRVEGRLACVDRRP